MAKKNISDKDRTCSLCTNNVKTIDYKNSEALRRFTSSYGKIVPKRKTNICSKHQRQLAQAIKRARYMALLPYTTR